MSKGLKEIKTLRGFNQVELNNDKNINKSLDIIEDELKVLKIVFEKKIDLNSFKTSLMVMNNFTYTYYINNSRNYHTCIMVKLLEEDEFDLLKRYCE